MVKIELPKGLPRFKLNKAKVANMLNDMADAAVVQIKEDVEKSKDINNRNLKKLKPSTIKQKRKKGYSNKPLIATGKMIRLFRTKTATAMKLEAHTNVRKKMLDIAFYHNTGSGHLPVRQWFGVGKKLIKRCNTIATIKSRQLIKTLWRRVR